MSKVFIHVGLNKTGSTFLQRSVFPSLDKTLYDQAFLEVLPSYHALLNHDAYEFDEINSRKFHEICNVKGDLILSDEAIPGRPIYRHQDRFRTASRLAKLFPDARILIFIRGQQEMLRSIYGQYVKGRLKGIKTPDKFFISAQLNATYQQYTPQDLQKFYSGEVIYLETLQYTKLIRMYQTLFGKVEVCLYEDLKFNPDIIYDQLSAYFEMKLPPNVLTTLRDSEALNIGMPVSNIHKARIKNLINNFSSTTPGRLTARVLSQLSGMTFSNNSIYQFDQFLPFYFEDNKALLDLVPRVQEMGQYYRTE